MKTSLSNPNRPSCADMCVDMWADKRGTFASSRALRDCWKALIETARWLAPMEGCAKAPRPRACIHMSQRGVRGREDGEDEQASDEDEALD